MCVPNLKDSPESKPQDKKPFEVNCYFIIRRDTVNGNCGITVIYSLKWLPPPAVVIQSSKFP